jgi:predicted ABC-type ATPase
VTASPWMWLIAGPNGAGKSTFAPNLSSDVEEIVMPDQLAYRLSATAPEKQAVRSARLAIDRIKSLLDERRSFAVETTLSGRFHLEMAARARAAGWKVGVIYIGLRSPKLAIERVRLRHIRGGHNVPPTDVRRRYARSLKNLVDIYRALDRVVVLDNSSARLRMKRIFEAREGRTVFRVPILPKWLRSLDRAIAPKR